MSTLDPKKALQELTEDRFYKYRGCAPDSDDPGRAAGDSSLSVSDWQAPDADGGEEQTARRAREAAAVEVCVSCPVMVKCLAYGSSVVTDGAVVRLAEPISILGGMTALERHKAFVKTRHEVAVPAPDRMVQTKQKDALLRALAQHVDPYEVAAAAGMDVRKANWHRSRLVTQLNLPKVGATRTALLEEAVRRGLVEASLVVPDDGTVPAVPYCPEPETQPAAGPEAELAADAGAGVEQANQTPVVSGPVQIALVPEPESGPVVPPSPPVPYEPARVPSPPRRRFTAVAGQLSFDDALMAATFTLLFQPVIPLGAVA
ncbi:hypothetical protein [Streptomyces bottropensis]|uniref:hypothetical protein n=1 Tax=Streptomyces bottropensis TaxID=42235 RepID=UPI0036817921